MQKTVGVKTLFVDVIDEPPRSSTFKGKIQHRKGSIIK